MQISHGPAAVMEELHLMMSLVITLGRQGAVMTPESESLPFICDLHSGYERWPGVKKRQIHLCCRFVTPVYVKWDSLDTAFIFLEKGENYDKITKKNRFDRGSFCTLIWNPAGCKRNAHYGGIPPG